MERRISTASRQTGAKNEKETGIDDYTYSLPCILIYAVIIFIINLITDLELYVHMYAVPSEVIRSNMYGSNCLEDNPAYLSNTHAHIATRKICLV